MLHLWNRINLWCLRIRVDVIENHSPIDQSDELDNSVELWYEVYFCIMWMPRVIKNGKHLICWLAASTGQSYFKWKQIEKFFEKYFYSTHRWKAVHCVSLGWKRSRCRSSCPCSGCSTVHAGLCRMSPPSWADPPRICSAATPQSPSCSALRPASSAYI